MLGDHNVASVRGIIYPERGGRVKTRVRMRVRVRARVRVRFSVRARVRARVRVCIGRGFAPERGRGSVRPRTVCEG